MTFHCLQCRIDVDSIALHMDEVHPVERPVARYPDDLPCDCGSGLARYECDPECA